MNAISVKEHFPELSDDEIKLVNNRRLHVDDLPEKLKLIRREIYRIRYANFTPEQREKQQIKYKKFREKMTPEELKAYDRKRNEQRREARENWNDEQWEHYYEKNRQYCKNYRNKNRGI